MLTSRFIKANGQQFHAMVGGAEDAPAILMLHGFPEYWAAWEAVALKLCDTHRVVLPDQRGFNLSSKPMDSGDYATKHLVADMIALLDAIAPNQKIILCGHDWGASVAYAMAMRHADRFSHLVIANGVHPMCFQKSLFANGAQRAASQYMNVLRAEGSEEHLSANRFEKLLRMLEKFSTAPWLDDETKERYRKAWSHPGALSAMLNWYRESPMVVPAVNAPARDFPIDEEMIQKHWIPVPHLLLWGEADTALLLESRADLPRFCEDLTVKKNQNGSHWILHEDPDWVAKNIRNFVT